MKLPYLVVVFASLLLAACASDALVGAEGELQVRPTQIDFPDTYVGYTNEVAITLANDGRAPKRIDLRVDPPFVVEPAFVELAGGDVRTVRAIYAPARLGQDTSTVVLSSGHEIPVQGRSLAVPECPPSTACRTVVFDPNGGGCVETRRPEGDSCSDACFDGTCREGECIGEARSCDDDNACTTDACDPASGCVHYDQAANCPPSEDPCRFAVCLAEGGCGYENAPDETACGPANCTTSNVCLNGTCTRVTTPDGGACGEETPCQEQGQCVEGACVQDPPVVLAPNWAYPAAPGATIHFDGTTDPLGNTIWAECTFASCDAVSVTARGLQRYRETLFVEDAGRSPTGSLALAQAGARLISTLAPGRLEMRESDDAGLVWSTDLLDVVAPDTTGPVNVWVDEAAAPVVADDVVIVPLNGFRATGDGDIEPWGGWVVALHLSNGKVRWIWEADGAFEGFVGDEGGSVFFTVRRHDAPPSEGGTFVSLGTTGAERWRLSTPFQAPVATLGGLLMQATGEIRTTERGSRRHELPVLLPTFPRRTPLMAGRHLYAFGVPLEECDVGRCPTWVPHLFRFDSTSGDEAWRLQLASGQTSQPVLTSDFTVMFAEQSLGGPGRGRQTWLTELAPDRSAVFSCELPGGRYDGPAALSAGQWVTVDAENRRVLAFGVGKRAHPQSGWITSGGSPAQTNRPR